MRRSWHKLLTVILITFFLVGCQATPEQPVVIQKDLEQMIEKAVGDETEEGEIVPEQPGNGENKSVALAERLGVPERYTAALESAKGNVSITADAQIMLPQVIQIPTAKVQLGRIEQDTADKIIERLIGGNPFYEVGEKNTKQDIERQLKMLYEMRDGTRPLDIEGPDTKNTMEDLTKVIFKIEQLMEEAIDETELPPAQRTYHETEYAKEIIEGYSRIDGEMVYLKITPENCMLFKGDSMHVSNAEHLVEGSRYADLEKTQQQAIDMADAFVAALGLDYMTLDCVYEAARRRLPEDTSVEPIEKVYKLQYVRKVGGVPITYTALDNNAAEGEKGQETYGKPWSYERITFLINDDGIRTFEWMSPYTEPEIVTDDTQMKSFDEIASVFENMVLIKNVWRSESDKFAWTLDVQEVRLGLMRVKAENIADTGLLIPVWDFMGHIVQTEVETGQVISEKDEEAGVVLTVNAIDGSVIDREFGY